MLIPNSSPNCFSSGLDEFGDVAIRGFAQPAEVLPLALPAAHRSAGPWARALRRLERNRLALCSAGFLVLVAGLAFVVPTVVAINVLGDGVRDALDPRLSIGVD